MPAPYRVHIGVETLTYLVVEKEYSLEAQQALVRVYNLLLEPARKDKVEEDSEVEANGGEVRRGDRRLGTAGGTTKPMGRSVTVVLPLLFFNQRNTAL